MKNFKIALPFLLITAAALYLFPLFISDTGSAMAVLLGFTPAAVFICAFLYGKMAGFDIVYPLLTAAIFLPAIFIYYNSTAWVYAPIYGVLALTAVFLGGLFFKNN